MTASARELWERYCRCRFADPALGISLDVSRVRFEDDDLDKTAPAMSRALDAMAALEGGAIANPDEQRMVGHYWLRAPDLAPTDEIKAAIAAAQASIHNFAQQVHDGTVRGAGGPFEHVLHIGIGGSALGPQFISEALGGDGDRMNLHFIDNTDPDGIDRALAVLDGLLGRTLVTVVSKSGRTPEPRNGMLEVQAAYQRAGLDVAPHAVAVTTAGSDLDRTAEEAGWLERFPLWDWVGGRTSVTSSVGLLPAALQGIDIDAFLAGAAAMDRVTRGRVPRRNPAALLALMWFWLGRGRGEKDMVILPYKDRLAMFGRYLQQLVMESLGKELDRAGVTVHQGIAVYGNKGSTDQHAFVQQLREGPPRFFVTFIGVLADRVGSSVEIEPGVTAGDYLCGFLHGTRRALYENGRESITITIDRVTPARVGALTALFERAVGLYGELVNVNAYHQPGVEAGKKAAAGILGLQKVVADELRSGGGARTAEQIAEAVGRPDDAETVFEILEHLAANPDRGVTMQPGDSPARTTFRPEARAGLGRRQRGG
ncbi:MAG: glucose-6-phosphate isomerase [Planctomycetota bacterium]|jgi:glucose-6-phosphate isomerase